MIIGDPTAWLLPLMLYSYGLGIASFGLLLRELVVTHRFSRTQVVVLLLAMVVSWVTVSPFNLRVVGFDVTPIGYVVSGVALSWAVTRAGLMDIVPVARELVVDTVDAGIVVEKLTQALDRMDDIIDDVLTLAREGQSIEATEPVAIDHLADRAWDNVDTGEATLAADTDLVVEADGDRLLRVFENLFRTAIEHGRPTVSVGVEAIDPESAGSAPPGPTGFAVEDDGPASPRTSARTSSRAATRPTRTAPGSASLSSGASSTPTAGTSG